MPESGCTPARSRNDQVATDVRLWLRGAIDELARQVHGLRRAFIDLAERHADTIMPGFTHLQVAQPVTFGHHLLAYDAMLARDAERLADCRKRVNRLPLGAAALAGTSYPIDRARVATELGFEGCARIRSTPSATATSRSNSRPPPRSSWCICRASPRSSCCGRIRASDS